MPKPTLTAKNSESRARGNALTQSLATKQHFYPEIAVGGYSRVDTSMEFYTRIEAILPQDGVVVDVGAGRGRRHQDGPDDLITKKSNFKGRCKKVLGIDVDKAVLTNPSLDEALVYDGGALPLSSDSADVILCDWVLEHLDDPTTFVSEIHRVLKPGGWFCARTPNKWGYIALGSRFVPRRLHSMVLRSAQPHRKTEDVFPTHYRLNSWKAFRRFFDGSQWTVYAYTVNGEPAYFGTNKLLWRLGLLGFRLVPPSFGAIFLVFAQKGTSMNVDTDAPRKITR